MQGIVLGIIAQIDFLIHKGVSLILSLIFKIADVEIFGDGSIGTFTSRVYGVLGVIILFKIIISAIQYLISPDKMTDKEKGFGGLLQRTIISVAMLALVPTIFDFARLAQDKITVAIPQIILGMKIEDTSDVESIGDNMSWITVDAFVSAKKDKDTSGYPMNSLEDFKNNVKQGCGWIGIADEDCIYDYNFIFSIGVGIFMLYVFLSMAIDVAIRTIKFGIIEILAPIPIASYINNQENFKSWYQNAFKVYADLFIRFIIIYFIIFVVILLTKNKITIKGGESILTDPLLSVFIIVGLLMFAKQAPKFISDLLGLKSDGMGGIVDMFKPAWSRAGNAASPLMHLARPVSDYRASRQNGESKGVALRRAFAGAARGVSHAVGGVFAGDDFAKSLSKYETATRKTKNRIADAGNYSGVKDRVTKTLQRLRDKARGLEENIGFTSDVTKEANANYNAYMTNRRNRLATLAGEINSGGLTDAERRLKIDEYNNINKEITDLSSKEGKANFLKKEKISISARNSQRSTYDINEANIANGNSRLAEISRIIAAGTSNENRIALENEAIRINENIAKWTSENNAIDVNGAADLANRREQIEGYLKELDEVNKSIKDTEVLKVRKHASVHTSVDTFFGGSGSKGESYVKFADMLGKNRGNIYTGEAMTKMKQNVDILVDLDGNQLKYTSDYSTNGYQFTYDEIESLVKDVGSGKVDIPTLQRVYGIKNSGTLDSAYSEIQKKAARDYVDANIAAEDSSVAANVKVRLKPGAKANSTIVEWWYRFEGELLASGLPRDEVNELHKQFKHDPGKFIAGASDLKERMATKGSTILDAEKPSNGGK